MRFSGAIVGIVLWAGACWGQSNEVERLSRVVEQQSQEIEQLKDRLARIQQVLGTRTAASVQPIAYTSAVQATTPIASQAPPAASPAGFRFSGDLRFRLDASIRGASPQPPVCRTSVGGIVSGSTQTATSLPT